MAFLTGDWGCGARLGHVKQTLQADQNRPLRLCAFARYLVIARCRLLVSELFHSLTLPLHYYLLC